MTYYKVGKTYSNKRFVPKDVANRLSQAPKTSKGLGDTVEKVIKLLGIQKIMGKTPCNCAKRKSWLNKLFPYS